MTDSTSSGNTNALDPVTSYARDVLSGRYTVGKLVRLACERHIRDLDTCAARGLYFDAGEAQAAIDFWQLCPHLKGRQFAGKLLHLGPWQRFVIGSVYGWKRTNGRRTPFFNGYRPQFYFRTTDVTGNATLPAGVEMVMPGDNVEMVVDLITPIALEKELRFAIREGGRTVGAGVVSEVLE